jgi:hypothetical protein
MSHHPHHHEPEPRQIPNRQLSRIIAQNDRIICLLRLIAREDEHPFLASIQIQFSKGTPMPTAGPLTLTQAGQTGTAVVTGVDQFGNSWTGAIPPVTYSIDDASIATSAPNPDGLTDLITAVANGTANLTASLTTAEGLALSDVEQVIVAIQAAPPVLSAIKVQFQ